METNTPSQRVFEDHHVYGKGASLCVSFSVTKGQEGKEETKKPTISLEAAKTNGVRSYDWSTKVVVQVSHAELPYVAAVLLGILPSCKFQHHGPKKDKWFEIENQGAHYFVKVGQAADVRALQVGLPDVTYVAALVLRRLATVLKLDELTTLQVLQRSLKGAAAPGQARAAG